MFVAFIIFFFLWLREWVCRGLRHRCGQMFNTLFSLVRVRQGTLQQVKILSFSKRSLSCHYYFLFYPQSPAATLQQRSHFPFNLTVKTRRIQLRQVLNKNAWKKRIWHLTFHVNINISQPRSHMSEKKPKENIERYNKYIFIFLVLHVIEQSGHNIRSNLNYFYKHLSQRRRLSYEAISDP